jgi:hypothetical protein
MIGDNDPRIVLLAAAEICRERAEKTAYGINCPDNPNDFFPDPDCSTQEERDAHRAACEAYDRGDYTPPAFGLAAAKIEEVNGVILMHPCPQPWGMGTYTIRDPKLVEVAEELERLADDYPESEAP